MVVGALGRHQLTDVGLKLNMHQIFGAAKAQHEALSRHCKYI